MKLSIFLALILSQPLIAKAEINPMLALTNFKAHAAVDCGDHQSFVGYNGGGLVRGGASWAGGGGNYLDFKLSPDSQYLTAAHSSHIIKDHQDEVEVRAHSPIGDEMDIEMRYKIKRGKKTYLASTRTKLPVDFFAKTDEQRQGVILTLSIFGTVPEKVLYMKDGDAWLEKNGFKEGDFIEREVHCYINNR